MILRISLFIVLNIQLSCVCLSQSKAINFESDIEWAGSQIRSEKFINRIGIDTIEGDTLLIMKESYLRLNSKGDTLEILDFKYCSSNAICSDDGYNFSGVYKEFYGSGNLKRIGNVVCNKKSGEWISFYENGSIHVYKNFVTYENSLGHPTPYLSGTYTEYFSNGNRKTSGTYRVVQKWSKFPVINKTCLLYTSPSPRD